MLALLTGTNRSKRAGGREWCLALNLKLFAGVDHVYDCNRNLAIASVWAKRLRKRIVVESRSRSESVAGSGTSEVCGPAARAAALVIGD